MKVAKPIPHFSYAQVIEAYELATSAESSATVVVVDGLAKMAAIHSLTGAVRFPTAEAGQRICESLNRNLPLLGEAWHAARLNLAASLAGELAVGEVEAYESDIRELPARGNPAQFYLNGPSVNVLRTYTPLSGETHFRVKRFDSSEEASDADTDSGDWIGVSLAAGDHLIIPGRPRPTVAQLVASTSKRLIETSLDARKTLSLVR